VKAVYAVPAVPAGSGEVLVIVSAAGLIVMANVPTAIRCALSVTDTRKLAGVVVAVVGVPETTPAELSVNPAGSVVPEARAQVYPGVPPLAANVNEYAVPTCPAGSGDVLVIVSAAALIVRAKLLLAVTAGWLESATLMVKL